MWLTADPHDCPIAQRAGHLVVGIPHDLIRPLVQVAGLQARKLALFTWVRYVCRIVTLVLKGFRQANSLISIVCLCKVWHVVTLLVQSHKIVAHSFLMT